MKCLEQDTLPRGWSQSTLGSITEKIVDGSHNPPPKQPNGYPMLSARNIEWAHIVFTDFRYISKEAFEAEQKRVDLKPGDVLLTIVGTIGRAAVIPDRAQAFALQRSVARLRPKGINSKFCMYQLLSDSVQNWLRNSARGSAQQGVYLKTLSSLPILVAPIEEQYQIVEEIEKQFTRLEAGVSALKRMQVNLKRYRASILKAACEGRLVPTEAELARKEGRTFEPADVLLQRILSERSKIMAKTSSRGTKQRDTVFINSQLPDSTHTLKLPEDWTWATVEQLSVFVQYGTSAKANENASGIPILRMGNIQEGKLHLKNLKYLTASHNEFPELLLANGDVLFNRTNSAELVGKTAVYKGNPEICSFASYLIRIRLLDGVVPKFLSYYINSTYGRAWIASVVNQQVGQANVNGSKLQALIVPLPPLVEQHRIVSEVERRLSVIDELEAVVAANLKRAERLRQAILHKAFTGQLV